MMLTIPVLSLWQPWASAMALGDKRVETRGWPTGKRGLVAIHAARKWSPSLRQLLPVEHPNALDPAHPRRPFARVYETYGDTPPLGGILALTLLTECKPGVSFLNRPGFTDTLEYLLGGYEDDEKGSRYGLITAGTVRVEPMIPLKGRQQLFFPWAIDSAELIAAVGGVTCLVNKSGTGLACLFCGHTALHGQIVLEDTAVCTACRRGHHPGRFRLA